MPPKRKRDDTEAAAAPSGRSTRSTRSSARAATSKDAEDEKVVKKPKAETKAKTTKAKASSTKSKAASKKKVVEPIDTIEISDDEEDRPIRRSKKQPDEEISEPEPKPKSSKNSQMSKKASNSSIPAQPPTSNKLEPYCQQRSIELFSNYADSEQPDVIGPDRLERLCTDAQIPMEGALPLILAWQLGCKEMGKITKDEWCKGTENLQISCLAALRLALTDLESLLILAGPQTPSKKQQKDPYNRAIYRTYVADKGDATQKLYSFCFTLAKPESSRNIEMETAAALWSVLLTPRYPLIAEILDFIAEKPSYKAANKDLWSMMLEFCQTVQPDLTGYDPEGAWPSLIDDFVVWKKAKLAGEGGSK